MCAHVRAARRVPHRPRICPPTQGGVDLNAPDQDFEASPLFIASSYGHKSVVKLLHENGVDIHASEHMGITSLHLAAREGHLELATFLIKQGQSAETLTESGTSPLWYAAYYGHADMAKMLLRRYKADPAAANMRGETPLFAASNNGHIQVVKLLVEVYGQSPNGTRTDGASVMMAACLGGHRDTARYLFSQGADVQHRDSNGAGVVEAAAMKGDQILIGFLTHAMEAAKEGLNYAEFVKKTEAARNSAEDDSYALTAKLAKQPGHGPSLYELGVAVAKLRREGEALDYFRKALVADPEAEYADHAKSLIEHIMANDLVSTQKAWDFIVDMKPRGPDIDVKALFQKALAARDEVLADDSAKVDAEEATQILQALELHVQQFFGFDLALRPDWLESDAFPFTRGGIYGPTLSDDYECECTEKESLESRRPTDTDACQMTVAVETWRFVSHSYALVGQQMLLGLLNVPGVCAFVVNPPYVERHWRPGHLGESQSLAKDELLMRVPLWRPGVHACPDVVIRSYWPLDIEPFPCPRTKVVVFGATEFKRAPHRWLKQMGFWNQTGPHVTLVSPSQWSANGFVRDGVDPERIRILPHGIDAAELHPTVVEDGAKAMREERGWDKDTFVFLHVGSMIDRKGYKELVAVYSEVVEWFETTFKKSCRGKSCPKKLKLVLKGSDRVANSVAAIDNFERNGIDGVNVRELFESGAVEYIGDQFSSSQIAELLASADTYVSAYKAEGFNLPVLEAAAVGTPVICTAGGPTDEFTRPEFALYVEAQQVMIEDPDEPEWNAVMLEPSKEDLKAKMQFAIQNPMWRKKAKKAAVEFVHSKYTVEQITRRLVAVILEKPAPAAEKQAPSDYLEL